MEELLELPVVTVPLDEPEPPALDAVLDAEALTLEALSDPVLTVLLLAVLLPELPVASGIVPAAVERVGITEGVPAGEVATAGWEVTTAGWVVTARAWEVTTSMLTLVLTGGMPVTTPRESVWLR